MTNPYETDVLLQQYLAFHYGQTYFGVDNYAAHCAQLCLTLCAQRPRRLALDLGCAVGRSSFELANGFDQVVGVDLSARFIDSAQGLQNGDTLSYWLCDEGDLGRTHTLTLRDTPMWANRERVRFQQADACKVDPGLPPADLVFAGNLIDRVTDPAAFLLGMKHRIAPGGLLVISSPYTLLADYTPKDHWIGGRFIDGQPQTMRQGMAALLSPDFDPLGEPADIPFVIRETARKYQHSVAELTVWERRGT